MNMLVKMADQKSIEALREEFVKLDKDGTGMINADELKLGIQQSDINIFQILKLRPLFQKLIISVMVKSITQNFWSRL
jgi:hypothetical protein